MENVEKSTDIYIELSTKELDISKLDAIMWNLTSRYYIINAVRPASYQWHKRNIFFGGGASHFSWFCPCMKSFFPIVEISLLVDPKQISLVSKGVPLFSL